MEELKINFSDVYPGFTPERSNLAKLLMREFPCKISDDPDYLIVSPYGHRHLRYDCVKIYFTGENDVPDFNLFDYAIGFDHLTFGDRYLRCPLFAFRDAFNGFRAQPSPSDGELLKRDFCSYVVSNGGGDPIRTRFFKELFKYKPVASGGRYMNNVGGPVKDKMSFISKYKFSITFENSSSPGYTTEKIMEPMSVWSLPIYWGDPLVTSDFQPQSFVSVKDEVDIERAIEEIIRLDRDDAAYLERCRAQPLVHGSPDYYRERVIGFFRHIFEQPLNRARRLIPYGCQAENYRPIYRKAFARYDAIERPINFARKVKRRLGL